MATQYGGGRWWSGQNGPDASREQDDESGGRVAADEYTRLLPNRIDSTDAPAPQFLSPDDPAVSPYNLWTVRVMGWATVLFTAVGFAWWTLLLVSMFVTPPGLRTRGSPFFAFGYASVALVLLLVTLAFFAVPAKSVRVLSGVLALMLAVDAIVVLAVSGIRHEETVPGIVSVTWAFFMALWTLIADHTVKWGKQEEEERLTGRPETRRTALEWTEVMICSFVVLVLCVVAVFMTCTLAIRAFDAGLQPPGERYWVDGGKYQIHVYCRGNDSSKATPRSMSGEPLPTVLIEGGEDPVETGLWQFADNALKNGTIARYCFADRPGFAWSDTAPSPLSASMATEALSEALVRAGEHGPWILLSAGIGSVYSRIFSSRHGRDIKGLLMVDPMHEDLLYRTANTGRGLALWLWGVLSPLGLDRIPSAIVGSRGRADRVWGRASGRTEKTLFARLQESLVADSLTKRDVVSSRAIQSRGVPLVIVSSGVHIRKDAVWEDRQRDLGTLTRDLLSWDVAQDAPHRVWKTWEGRDLIERRLKLLMREK